jgi:acetyltransferase-like isoleucine patch superfamily enzyme
MKKILELKKKIKIIIISKMFLTGLLSIYSKPKVFKIKYKNKNLMISNTVDITHLDKVEFGKNVFIWHFTIIDSFNEIKIGDFVQIGTRVSLFTHSSHNSIRLLNEAYHDIHFTNHIGRIKGSIKIGSFTFIGANAIIMPGTEIGKGCIVGAFSYVQGTFPDFSIISGNPAKIIGHTKKIDLRSLKKHPQHYLDKYLKVFSESDI